MISLEVVALALLLGVRDVVWLLDVASVVFRVMQVKQQFRQEKGPSLVLGGAWLQLLFWCPGSMAQSSSEVK